MSDASRSDRSVIDSGVQHLRWRAKRAGEAFDRLALADLHRDRRRSLYICSWQRSGSTWLAEIIASAPRTRLIYEPANVRQKFFTDGEPRLVSLPLAGPRDDLGDDAKFLDRALRGSLQTKWTNQINAERLPERRVAKDIRTVSILPWIADRYDDLPVILLLRHPMAVAHSIIELGWTMNATTLADDEVSAADPELAHRLRAETLLSEITLWSAHHAWAMAHPASANVHVMFYEDLVANSDVELARLTSYLTAFHPVWQGWIPDPSAVARPSKTSFRGTRDTPDAWVDSWSASYDERTVEEAMRILRVHGLEVIYGASPRPLVEGSVALEAVRSRHASPADGA